MSLTKRILSAVLIACIAVGMFPITSRAELRKKISSVSMTIISHIELGKGPSEDDIEVEVKNDRYSVGPVEVLNDSFRWEETDVPEFMITLYAEEGYYFSLNKSNVTAKGEGAVVTGTKTEDTSQTLKVTVKLDSLNQIVGEIPSVSWSGTRAVWEPAAGAGSYEVRILRDGTIIGNSRTTTNTYFDFADVMKKKGTYTFKVRPVNAYNPDHKGEWQESAGVYMEAQQAGSGSEDTAEGWKQDETGWWYRQADGTYVKSDWREISGKWYYFGDDGYMATGWTLWDGKWYYLSPDGSLLLDGETPDHFIVGPDGAWVQNAS